jgi:hypothetical protein
MATPTETGSNNRHVDSLERRPERPDPLPVLSVAIAGPEGAALGQGYSDLGYEDRRVDAENLVAGQPDLLGVVDVAVDGFLLVPEDRLTFGDKVLRSMPSMIIPDREIVRVSLESSIDCSRIRFLESPVSETARAGTTISV